VDSGKHLAEVVSEGPIIGVPIDFCAWGTDAPPKDGG